MQHASSDAYADGNYPAYDNSAYPDYNEYPPQSQYGQYDAQPYSDMGPEHMGAGAAGAGLAGAGAAAVAGGAAAAAASGIHDNMMVRVKVAFVRSLEDELGESVSGWTMRSFRADFSYHSWPTTLPAHGLRRRMDAV